MTNRSRLRWARGSVTCLLAAVAVACGTSRAPAPGAGDSRGGVPDLTGVKVMVYPVQSSSGISGDADAELLFALRARVPEADWIDPGELRRAAARSPGLEIEVDRLPVGVFMTTEVRRVGDPLFGHLLRLGSVTNSRVALVPVAVRYRIGDPGTESGGVTSDAMGTGDGAVDVTAALINAGDGRVIWFGVVAGNVAGRSDPAGLASAMDAVARRFVPPARRRIEEG